MVIDSWPTSRSFDGNRRSAVPQPALAAGEAASEIVASRGVIVLVLNGFGAVATSRTTRPGH